MGIFGKLKNMITGGGATVTLEAVDPSLTQPFKVTINAVVGDADLAIKRVYLRIAGEENVVVRDVQIAKTFGDEVRVEREDVGGSAVTFEDEVEVAGEQTLEANQEYTWETEISFPEGNLPTYRGTIASHEWKLFAGLDARGNDPDSGWVDIELY